MTRGVSEKERPSRRMYPRCWRVRRKRRAAARGRPASRATSLRVSVGLSREKHLMTARPLSRDWTKYDPIGVAVFRFVTTLEAPLIAADVIVRGRLTYRRRHEQAAITSGDVRPTTAGQTPEKALDSSARPLRFSTSQIRTRVRCTNKVSRSGWGR